MDAAELKRGAIIGKNANKGQKENCPDFLVKNRAGTLDKLFRRKGKIGGHERGLFWNIFLYFNCRGENGYLLFT